MKSDNETQGQKEPAGTLPLACPQPGRMGRGWKEPGDTGTNRGTTGLVRRDLGFPCLGDTGIHKSIVKAAFNS